MGRTVSQSASRLAGRHAGLSVGPSRAGDERSGPTLGSRA